MTRKHRFTGAASLLLLASGVWAQPAPAATAALVDASGRPAGKVSFTDTPAGLRVSIQAQGLAPGEHGMHVHQVGECKASVDAATGKEVPFGAAGTHFDPMDSHAHGHPSDPAERGHAGDLPNLVAGADGRASVEYVSTKLSVKPGKNSVLGRALIVHEKPDDYRTNPTGASGGRVLCGVINPA